MGAKSVIERYPASNAPEAEWLTPEAVQRIRRDFPVLQKEVHGKPLVYLDNGATTQKPRPVIEAMTHFYNESYGTVRRGVYALSAEATQKFEDARETVARFLNAPSPDTIVFTKGTTEAINLVAATFGRTNIGPGDAVIISGLEHHANLVPWQQLCLEKGAELKVIPVLDDGTLDLAVYETLLTPNVKLVAVAHVSNALGTVNPVEAMIQQAHAKGIPVLVDGAQGAPHMPVDVQAMDCDFYAFSGHKIYGPTGIGVLYGKLQHLNAMPPYQFGGDMIDWVTFEKTTFAPPPRRFEAGTPPIVEVIGLAAALAYVTGIGLKVIAEYEQTLLREATEKILKVPGVRILGTAPEKAAVLSFLMAEHIHPHDIGTLLDEEGIAVRAGHHCAQPLMHRFGVPATARASFAFYNTMDDVDALVRGLHKIRSVFGDA